MKKLTLLIVLIILIAIGVFAVNSNRVINTQKTPTISPQPTNAHPSPTSSDEAIPNEWQTYQSKEWNFTIKHPQDVRVELTQGGAHFLKLGDTQATGTELFDGLSLLIFSAALYETTYDAFVQSEYQKAKNEPVTEAITELKKVTINGKTADTFTVSAIGKRTVMYLPKGNNEYVRITDSTVEPGNVQRDFHDTVNKMLSTLTF
jgi:cytoskeletal protein RodZ